MALVPHDNSGCISCTLLPQGPTGGSDYICEYNSVSAHSESVQLNDAYMRFAELDLKLPPKLTSLFTFCYNRAGTSCKRVD